MHVSGANLRNPVALQNYLCEQGIKDLPEQPENPQAPSLTYTQKVDPEP